MMEQRRNRRLANVKTRSETGLDHVMFNLNLNTPFGKKQLKEIRPFYRVRKSFFARSWIG